MAGPAPGAPHRAVEANDGYALGAYGIAADRYADLLLARWAQWMATRRPAPDRPVVPAGGKPG